MVAFSGDNDELKPRAYLRGLYYDSIEACLHKGEIQLLGQVTQDVVGSR